MSVSTLRRSPAPQASPRVLALWDTLVDESVRSAESDPAMAAFVERAVGRHASFAKSLASLLGEKLADPGLGETLLAGLVSDAVQANPDILEAAAEDLIAVRERDPATPDHLTAFLFFKGYQALQAHRVAHHLWVSGRCHLASAIQSRASERFAVDLHPAARLGRRILLDHGTGLVVGETAVIDDDVSILQGVTLGGTGKNCGDRHPKIRRGVLIGAGAKVLGNIEIGEGAKIGAGSIVLEAVHPYTTVVGNPARPLGVQHKTMPALTMDQTLPPVDYII